MHRRETKAAVTDRDRCHTMPASDRAVRIPVELRIIVRVQVDRTRSDDQAGSVKHFGRIGTLEPANFGNLAVLDPNVGTVARQLGAVDNHAVLNDRVELSHYLLLLRIVKICPNTCTARPLATNFSRRFTAFAPGARFVIVAAGAENVRLSRLARSRHPVQARQFGPEASMTAALFKSEFDCWLHQQEPLA